MEVLGEYLKAEASGSDTSAIQLEKELNNAGWYITNGQDGMTVKRKEMESLIPTVDDFYLPKESTITPSPSGDHPNRRLWITIGITTAVLTLVIVVIIIIKKRKNATRMVEISKRS